MSEVRAPSVGRVVEVLVAVGDVVTVGQEVAVVESMKVEIPVVAERAGRVVDVVAVSGVTVRAGEVLVRLE